jgi:hypothetical protein
MTQGCYMDGHDGAWFSPHKKKEKSSLGSHLAAALSQCYVGEDTRDHSSEVKTRELEEAALQEPQLPACRITLPATKGRSLVGLSQVHH